MDDIRTDILRAYFNATEIQLRGSGMLEIADKVAQLRKRALGEAPPDLREKLDVVCRECGAKHCHGHRDDREAGR